MIFIPVRQIMSRDVVTVRSDTSLGTARQMLAEHRIRRLPVMESRRLIGIVSDRDLRSASRMSDRVPVGEIMTKNVVTITPDMSADEAAHIILDGRFGGLPVVERGELVGIITETDLLRALVVVLETEAGDRITIEFGDAA